LPLGGGGGPTPAFAASLVRFANTTPRLLLQLPGWRVNFVTQYGRGAAEMHFIDRPHNETRGATSEEKALDRYPVQLNWAPVTGKFEQAFRAHDGNTGGGETGLPEEPLLADLPGGIGLPSSGMKSANIPTGLGVPIKWLYYEGHSKHQIGVNAYTFYDHLLIRISLSAPNMAGVRAILAGLRQVNVNTWLRAMPASVIKDVESGAAIKQLLEGIPLPPGLDASKIPGVHDTQTKYYLGTDLAGAVACTWFADWDRARAAGDHAAEQRAVTAMSTARSWPLFRWMSRQGQWPSLVIYPLADAMAHDNWHGQQPAEYVSSYLDLDCPQLGVKLAPDGGSGLKTIGRPQAERGH
jgi:hypothetical protein